MKDRNFRIMVARVLAAALVCGASASAALAQVDTSWTGQAGNGSWVDGGNWALGIYPSAAGDTARFTQPDPAGLSIHLDAPIRLGRLILSRYGGSGYLLDAGAAGSLAFDNAGAGALVEVEGTHVVTAPITLDDALAIQNRWQAGSGAGALWLQGTVSGGSGLTIRTAAGGPAPVTTAQAPGTNVYLTAESTFQGSATVRAGANSLTLIGPGTALSAATFTVDHGASLNVDNSLQNVPDRVTSPVLLNGGTLRLYGAAGDFSTEELCLVEALAGASAIECTRGTGGLAMLTLSELDTAYGTTVRFGGQDLGAGSHVFMNPLWGGPPMDDGILGGWAVVGPDFADYDPAAGVRPFSNYALIDINSAGPTDNLAIMGPAALAGDRSVNSLKLAAGGTVDLAGHTLNVESGGVILGPADSAGTPVCLGGGRLTAGGGTPGAELILHLATRTFTLDADIVDNPGGSVSLVVSGDGSPSRPGGPTLVLRGNNTYTGRTYINACTVAVDSNEQLGDPAAPVVLTGGTLRATGSFASERLLFVQGLAAIETPGTWLDLYSPVFGDVETLYVRGGGGLTLAGENLVAGAVDVGVNQYLGLRDGGTARNVCAITLHPRAALELDNTNLNISDRVAAPVTSRGGRLELYGSFAAALTQTIPAFDARPGASVIACTSAGRAAILEIDSLQRAAGATVDFWMADALSQIMLPGQPPLANGLLGAWAVAGDDWATLDLPYGPNVRPLADGEYYTGDINLAEPDQNVKYVLPVALGQSMGVNSLKLATPAPLDLGGNLLSLESGGLLVGAETDGSGMMVGGILTTGAFGGGADELIVHLRASAVLGVTIMDGPRPLSLTVSGDAFAWYPNWLLLMSDNLYTGATTVNAATLAIDDESSLGLGAAPLTLVDGTLLAMGSFTMERPIGMDGLATLDVWDGDTLTASGPVFGEGDLLQITGGGTVALTGANVFRSPILVGDAPGLPQAGQQSGITTLQIASDANLGDPTNGVTLNEGRLLVSGTFEADAARVFTVGPWGGTFDVDEHQTFTLAGPGQLALSWGTMTKAGLGRMVLGGAVSASTPATLAVLGGELVLNADAHGLGPEEPPVVTVSVSGVGATATFNASQHLAGLELSAQGRAVVAPGANKVLVTHGLSIDPAAAQLDLTDNSMIVRYTGGTPYMPSAELENIKAWIAAGYDWMSWAGKGIVSSAAVADPISLGIGYAQNDMLFAPYDVFSGEPVDSSTILVKFTYNGDLNLDGCVDDNDVTFFNLFYDGGLTTSHYWNEGDIFGYDGRVDDNDVTILGLTYGLGIGSPLGGAAPEPATLGLIALGAIAIAGRRRAR